MESVINSMQWSDAIISMKWSEERSVKGGQMFLKNADPTELFWNLYRNHKDELRQAGFAVTKYGAHWKANWWKKDGEYRMPLIAHDIEVEELKLRPLVNETVLKPYQKPLVQILVAAMDRWGVSLNGSTTGTGKTYHTLGAVRERGRKLLVICPKSITPDWKRAAHHMGVELVGAFGWEWIKTGKTPFGVWNMLAMDMKGGKTKYVKGDFVWNVPPDVDLVFDEAHRCGAISTQNAGLVIQAHKARLPMYLLSATIANDPTKMRAIGYALGLHKDGRSFYEWMAKNGVREEQFLMGGRRIKTYKFRGTAYQLQRIHASIFPSKGCRVRADQLGDQFPATQIIAKAYQMDEEKEIQAAYREMQAQVDRIMAEKSSKDRNACILTEILRARQRVELLKIPLFVSLTRDALEEGNSVFLAVNFRETLAELAKQLKITALVQGGQSEHARRDALDDFQDNKVRVIAGIIQACREGLNLHDVKGSHPRMSFIMPTQSAFDLKQVLGRVHRVGGMSPSIQRIVFAAGTIEESVCHGLASKLDCLDLLCDGHLQHGIFPDTYSNMRPD